jgi:hypothetical protein
MENIMSASYSALQLGYLPWQVKWCQETLWRDRPTEITEVDGLLEEIDFALPALADRITSHQRSEVAKLLKRIRQRHQHVANRNSAHYFSILRIKDRKRIQLRYHEYLMDETNHRFREWQKDDCRNLRSILETIVRADRRLQAYCEIGNHLGKGIDVLKRESGSLSEEELAYIFSGMKKLPLREQIEVGRIIESTGNDMISVAKQVKTMGRFLKIHEKDLVATPKWDGKTITYRGHSEQIRVQENGIMAIILDEAEKQKWPDAIRLPPELAAKKRKVVKELARNNLNILIE